MDADWKRYKEYLCECPEIGLMLDISGMNFPDDFLARMEPAMQMAFDAMAELELGAIANPDENRMVGHYWLRNPQRAPEPGIAAEIGFAIRDIKEFAASIHSGEIAPPDRRAFTRLLIIGIGGSALGPQFVADALGTASDRMKPYFLDNTDPDGMDRVFAELGSAMAETLIVVISKSGGTKETRNGMVEAQAAFRAAGLDFPKHAVAITGAGSELDKVAVSDGWIARFPMWDWVGGRSSVTSSVGLLPAALQGLDFDGLLAGARVCDDLTRNKLTKANPAALLALMWHHATNGRGEKDMVVLPYKDRLLLFSRYLQQLIMESIGKEKDLAGNLVNQGITVYGNKGATDQHAYVQQLREGVNNFFATFIEVLEDRAGRSMEVEPGVTSGDFLAGFLQGTRQALAGNGRQSVTITIDRLDASSIGVLIALYERAVGFYASLVGVNAYHQPGVEAGKKAAGTVLELQGKIMAQLKAVSGASYSADELAAALGRLEQADTIFRILLHLAANTGRGVIMERTAPVWLSRFRYEGG